MAICHRHGLGVLSSQRRLTAAGDTLFTDAIVALEATFGIDIEMDETWTGMTVPQLLALVDAKTSDLHRKALLPANDYFPAEPAPFIRRTPMVGIPPIAHAVRAERIAERKARRQFMRRLVIEYPASLGFFSALAFYALSPR